MRTFNLPKIDIRTPKLEETSTEDFLKDNVKFHKTHFMSRSKIVEVAQELPPWMQNQISISAERAKNQGKSFSEEDQAKKYLNEIKSPHKAVSRFVTSLHDAFALHIPFTISPDVIMMMISQEVAQYVKDHSTETSVAALFTKNPDEKEFINVEVDHFRYGSPENDWLEAMTGFKTQLVEKVPSGILEHLTPKLSGATGETSIAHLVSFMDAASSYYSYGMSTCCGVPAFRLDGTPDDWQNILNSVEKMESLLPGLGLYFTNLKPILREIRNTLDGNKVDNDFWASIYKENGGSGGPYSNGWFNNLFAHTKQRDYRTGEIKFTLKEKVENFGYTLLDGNSYEDKDQYSAGFRGVKKHGAGGFGGPKLNNFPTNISSVPFVWNYLGNEIPMRFVAGIIGVEMEEGFMTPKLGVAVVECEEGVEGK